MRNDAHDRALNVCLSALDFTNGSTAVHCAHFLEERGTNLSCLKAGKSQVDGN